MVKIEQDPAQFRRTNFPFFSRLLSEPKSKTQKDIEFFFDQGDPLSLIKSLTRFRQSTLRQEEEAMPLEADAMIKEKGRLVSF